MIAPPGYKLDSEDTPYEVELKMYELYRKMEPWQKIHKVCELGRTVELLTMAQLKKDYPSASELELKLRFACRKYGHALIKEAYGWAPE